MLMAALKVSALASESEDTCPTLANRQLVSLTLHKQFLRPLKDVINGHQTFVPFAPAGHSTTAGVVKLLLSPP